MAHDLTFYGWQRSGVYDLATGTLEDGRLQASVQVTLQNRENPADQVTRPLPFLIAGPPDATGLLPGAITTHYPPPNSTNAETTKFPYLEFSAADLPWRYSPRLAGGLALSPWIVLVVGTPEEVQLEANQMVTITTDAQTDHPLKPSLPLHPVGLSVRWAHVQDDGGRVTSRLLSSKVLTGDQEWVAVVVSAFDSDGNPAWDGSASVLLPCYHFWHFRTSELGDFKTLASRLKPGLADPELGRAPLEYWRVDPPANLFVRGALAPIGGTDVLLDADVAADVGELLTPLVDPRGRPVVNLPRYGEPWVADPMSVPWGAAANGDPRHRGAAGLGLWTGIELQETIVAAAADQVGALDIADQRIRQLTLGLSAVRSLWNRRLPASPGQRLQLYGPSLRRIPATTGTALDTISGAGRALPPRLFSSAARRVLRPGPARSSLADPQATLPDRVLEQANTCPRPPERVVNGLPHADFVSEVLGLPTLEELIERGPAREGLQAFLERFLQTVEESEFFDLLGQIFEFVRSRFDEPERLPLSKLLEILIVLANEDVEELRLLVETFPFEEEPEFDFFVKFGSGLVTGPPDRPCQPVDLTRLEEILTASIDPTVAQPLVVRRVLSGITGLDPAQPLAPVEVCLGLELPVWTFLRDRAPDWLLPGVNSLKEDAVIGLESNPTFVNAFFLGLNTQVLSELRWRNLRIATGCTPMRTFWGQIDLTGDRSMPDIRGIDVWSDSSSLGDPSHQPPPVTAANDLVMVFRSDLFRRYPNTLVYAAPAPLDDDGKPGWEADPPFGSGDRLFPTFQGSIGEDITFFRFELAPSHAWRYWIALEEPPSGYSFRNNVPVAVDVNDGATFANITFSNPVRVLIRGESLIPKEA